MNKSVFLFSGEGTQSSESQFRLLKQSPSWTRIEAFLSSKLNLDLEHLWKREIGEHHCPYSPLLTVVSQICLSDLWRQWGYRPDVMVGHSTGELSAAYQAGFYSLEEILLIAYRIGEVAARLDGVMLHGLLSESEIEQLQVNLSSFNFEDSAGKHVTVSGYTDEMEDFHRQHPQFVQMKLPHPWHHSDYGRFSDQLMRVKSHRIDDGSFVSGLTTRFETQLDDDHWHQWMVKPIDFIQTMRTLNDRYGDDHLDIIEIGFHPVLEPCCNIFEDHTHASSMFRGEDDIKWILYQRKKLDQDMFLAELTRIIDTFRPELDFGLSLAYQGFDSLKFTEFSVLLQPFFPSLAPQDFYRYKTVNQLIDRFGIEASIELPGNRNYQSNGVVIAGMSCRFPSSVETLTQFWDMLVSQTDQVKFEAGRGRSEAGYLNDAVSRFDHQYFNISLAEARTMDPQQILALELTEMLWKDAGIDPETLDKKRIGVYIGAWSQEYRGDKRSVYFPSGTNPSVIASRISYHYDLRGPSWVSNTACSSSLVAVHYAAKDIEAGRVDYAIAGGVNMLLDEELTANMRKAGFLSRDDRCNAFDASANGYVRAEGGGLVLLANQALVNTFYAELTGSAINQNGGRAQVITAPHPEAQEEVIVAACQDARIAPQEIAYIECHGTGTKIGDPIEISAILNTIAKNRTDTFYVGSVKSNMGHLESAAGIAGLIKSVAVLNHGIIPPNLHFQQLNPHIDFKSLPIQVVTAKTRIDNQANIGVSSFGFGGSNAHIVVKGAQASVRKEIRPIEIPFDRGRAASLSPYLRLLKPETAESDVEPAVLFEYPLVDQFSDEIEKRIAGQVDNGREKLVTRETVVNLVNGLFFQLTGIETIEPEIELTDQGLDSMSGTELISQLETSLNIELGPEILFEFPLRDQFIDEVYALTGGRMN